MGFLSSIFKGNNETVYNQKKRATVMKKSTDIQVDRNIMAKEYESNGELDKAIELYELNVGESFDGSAPYNRLAIIYHKQKKFEDEERVLMQGIKVFEGLKASKSSRKDIEPKLRKFKDRLNKLQNSKKN